MRADPRFLGQPKPFWANVRTISQEIGYTSRKTGQVRVYSIEEMAAAMTSARLGVGHLTGVRGTTELGRTLAVYFEYRADVLNRYVEPRLMDVEAARTEFEGLKGRLNPSCPIPNNKQKGEKAGPALLTGIVNMLVEANCGGVPVDYDPRELTTFTKDGAPLRTLARRVDGCFPGPVNPIAVWEVKEYYYTTTFGSRVADGVYETLLDGLELEELREHEGIHADHLLIVDSHYTWWECGRSYLCRMIDMLNMGCVDEILFGREVLEKLPQLVRAWVNRYRDRQELGRPGAQGGAPAT
jgi:hypothetical protein